MFESIEELKQRVMPALKIRTNELINENIKTTPDDIFKDLSNKKWKTNKDLHLYEIVNDILNYKSKESDNNESK